MTVSTTMIEKVARALSVARRKRALVAFPQATPALASDDGWERYIPDATAALTAMREHDLRDEGVGMRQALEKCRDKFREYEGLHALKLRDYKGKEPLNYAAEIQFKIDRNREMAEMCETALASSAPVASGDAS